MTILPYVELEKTPNGNLKLSLTESGRERLAEIGDNPGDILRDLLEHHFCNGWRHLRPEEIGALTDGTLLTDDWEEKDNGELIHVGRVYWDANYQVEDAIEKMEKDGFVIWGGHN